MAVESIWAPTNLCAGAERLGCQLLSGGQPAALWGIERAAAAFPATYLKDYKPGTVCRFNALETGAMVVGFAATTTAAGVAVINHNLKSDSKLYLMGSATGAGASWTQVSDLSSLLIHPKFFKAFGSTGYKFWALVVDTLGSLTSPWELGEFMLVVPKTMPRAFQFDAVPRGLSGRNVEVESAFGVIAAKHLASGEVFEGTIGDGLTTAQLDDVELLITSTGYGANPFLWVNDADSPKAIVGRGDNFKEFLPRVLPSIAEGAVYAGPPLRVVEVPWAKSAI